MPTSPPVCGQVAQRQLDDHGRDHAEDQAGREEDQRGDEDDAQDQQRGAVERQDAAQAVVRVDQLAVGIDVAMLISGRMARLARPPATSRMPSVRRSGQRSAMRPPR